eukprot:419541-Prymnesium_polylepis.1
MPFCWGCAHDASSANSTEKRRVLPQGWTCGTSNGTHARKTPAAAATSTALKCHVEVLRVAAASGVRLLLG